jgi:hypothetical protein
VSRSLFLSIDRWERKVEFDAAIEHHAQKIFNQFRDAESGEQLTSRSESEIRELLWTDRRALPRHRLQRHCAGNPDNQIKYRSVLDTSLSTPVTPS